MRETATYIPTMEELLDGRASERAFHSTLDTFVPGVVGRNLYKKRLTTRPSVDGKLYTASDEAFMLLVLENSWDRWIDVYENGGPAGTNGTSEATDRGWKFVSDVPTLYTSGGIRYSGESRQKATNGWTPGGIERYNELFKKVKLDREKRPGPFVEWVSAVFAGDDDSTGAKGLFGTNLQENRVPIESDLFQELGVNDNSRAIDRMSSEVAGGDEQGWDDAICDSDVGEETQV